MDNEKRINNSFINDVVFTKEAIKSLQDSIYRYYPENCFEVLPLLHKAYDNLALTIYRLSKSS